MNSVFSLLLPSLVSASTSLPSGMPELVKGMWKRMSPSQRKAFIQSEEVLAQLHANGFNRGNASSIAVRALLEGLAGENKAMEDALVAFDAEFAVMESDSGFYWVSSAEEGPTTQHREDSVADAHAQLLPAAAPPNTVRVIVLCTNASGEPEFVAFQGEFTEDAVTNGDHYDQAISHAESKGYEGSMVAFAENDPAARQLGHLFSTLG